MFLGPINVRASRKDVQLKVKEEYNSYRVIFVSVAFQLTHFQSFACSKSFFVFYRINFTVRQVPCH